MSGWFVYMLRCADDSIYTGITTDIRRRVEEHNSGRSGAAYTRSRRPVELIYQENCDSRANASRREYQIRKLGRDEKRRLAGANRIKISVP